MAPLFLQKISLSSSILFLLQKKHLKRAQVEFRTDFLTIHYLWIQEFLPMTSTYHLSSAQDLTTDILEAIKLAFKNKSITIVVQEDTDNYELSEEEKSILDDRLNEDKSDYITGEESLKQLKDKYGI